MKSTRRFSKASGTDRAKVEKLIRRGWEPGKAIGKVLSRSNRRGGQAHE